MIKLVLKTNSRDYFEGYREGKKFIFSKFKFGEEKSIEEINSWFEVAELPGYLKDKYNLIKMVDMPLDNIFEIENFGKPILNPMNYNLFEYDFFINGNKNPDNCLKSACICKDDNYFYIAIEPYDSPVTREDRRKIDKFVNENIKEIKKILKMDFSHTEEY